MHAAQRICSAFGLQRTVYGVILVSAVLPFVPSVFGQWAADDFIIVEGFLREYPTWALFLHASFLDNFGGIGGLYRPVGLTSIYCDLRLFGPNPVALHLSSLAWHALASILVLALGRNLLVSPGRLLPLLCAGAFFSAFPRRVEAVAWASCRPDLVAGACGIAAMVLWLRFGNARSRAASLALYALSLLSKETAVLLPAALPLAGQATRRSVLQLWPFLAVTAVVAVLRRAAIGEWVGGAANAPSLSVSSLTNAAKLVAYSVLPPLQELNRVLAGNSSIYYLSLFTVATLLTSAAVVCWRYRTERLVRFGTAWLAASVVPVVGIAPSLSSTMNDRVLYLPSAGVALVLLGVLQGSSRRVNMLVASALVAGAAWSFALSTNWLVAGRETARLVAAIAEAVRATPDGCMVRVASVPDNYLGAYMLRNGTTAALRLAGLSLSDAGRVEILSHYWLSDTGRVPIEVNVIDGKRIDVSGVGGRAEVVLVYGDALKVGRVEAAPSWDRHARHSRVAVELATAGAVLAPVSRASNLTFLRGCD